MKQRIISGAIILLATVACILIGGNFFKLVCFLIAAYGTREYVNVIKKEFNLTLYSIMFFGVVMMFLFHEYMVQILICELLLLVTSCVFDEGITYADICSVFLMSFLLGYSLYYLEYIEAYSKFMMGYLFIIAYLTDVFALFTGMLFGKHKLNERISPKKTIEGAIGGWLIGGAVAFVYAYLCSFFYIDAYIIVILSIMLPIISQIGDLVFSAIKRFYGVKDFSNLIPGHGGLLDRLDSLIISVSFFGVIISILL